MELKTTPDQDAALQWAADHANKARAKDDQFTAESYLQFRNQEILDALCRECAAERCAAVGELSPQEVQGILNYRASDAAKQAAVKEQLGVQ